MKFTRKLTIDIPETPMSQVMCANGLVCVYGSDGLWHGGTATYTTAELAKHAVRVVHEAPGGQR